MHTLLEPGIVQIGPGNRGRVLGASIAEEFGLAIAECQLRRNDACHLE